MTDEANTTDAAAEAAKWQERADRFKGTPVAASLRAAAAKWRKLAEEAPR